MNKKGVALVIIFSTILVLSVIGTTIVLRSVNERINAQRYIDSTQAFWLAEAGANKAFKELKGNNFTSLNNIPATSLGEGGYWVVIEPETVDHSRNVTAHGTIPFSSPYRSERIVRTVIRKEGTIPEGFYNNTIYTPGYIDGPNSNNAVIDGSVRYGDNATTDLDRVDFVNGTPLYDSNLTSLPTLDFTSLREISQSQGNYHNSTQLNGPFPSSFWYNETTGIPNVVFMEGNLDLTGKVSVSGFFIIGGDLIYNATFGGNAALDGCVYSPGSFTINGGGNTLNVNGGVWSGNSTLNGNAKLTFNQTYMSAINGLDINRVLKLKSWQDEQNPYSLK